jgi:hypothetical protein
MLVPSKKCETLSKKQLKLKGPRDTTQVLECLTSKHKSLSSNPSTTRKEEETNKTNVNKQQNTDAPSSETIM